MEYRRFGRTALQMPVISCGGMRYQQSWKGDDTVSEESQRNVNACVQKALELGINHIETARGYGTSEYQLGKILPQLPREELIVQTKVGPDHDVERFRHHFETSMQLLGVDYLDLFAFHGINTEKNLEAALLCLPQVEQWRREGRVRFIGFSTHGPTDVIVKAVQTGVFDYVNLHWYYIFQDNWPAIIEARRQDMGVFIISPNDKGGLLYKPSDTLMRLTEPLHPMVFNGLYCLSKPEVHTLSCGVSRPEDFDAHVTTIDRVSRAAETVAPVVRRLEAHAARVLGTEWAETWQMGLPEWQDTPKGINIPWILRLRNLALAYDMVEYGKMRYNLLGNGGEWFPGNKADALDGAELSECLARSPHADVIPGYLREAHELLSGDDVKRLQED
jgi:hypothetical protein